MIFNLYETRPPPQTAAPVEVPQVLKNIIQVKNILLVQYNNVYEHFPNTKRAVKGQIPKPFTFHEKDGNKVLVCFLNGTLFMILYICTMFTLQ